MRTTKDLIKRKLWDGKLPYEDLVTSFTLVEAVINFRYLTFLSSDPEVAQTLTPSSLLPSTTAMREPHLRRVMSVGALDIVKL